MGDAAMGAAIFAFFVLCSVYVGWCVRIVGDDPNATPAVGPGAGDPGTTTDTDTDTDTDTLAPR